MALAFPLNFRFILSQPLLDAIEFRLQPMNDLVLLFQQFQQLLGPELSPLKLDSDLVWLHARIVSPF